MTNYKRGLFSLSADPVTYGHLDIIDRASKQCDTLIVAILHSPEKVKSYLFSGENRVSYLKRVIGDFCQNNNIEVIIFSESASDMMLRENCDVLYRGIRNDKDREYEQGQLKYHDYVYPELSTKTVFLEASDALKDISSTIVRSFAQDHIDVTDFTPMFIQSKLWKTLHNQRMIGVTGVYQCEKTTIIQEAMKELRKEGIPCHHIEIEKLITETLLEDIPSMKFLTSEFRVKSRDFPAIKYTFRDLYYHLYRAYRQKLKGLKGVIFVEWTYLTEDHLCHWVNNNVVVITRAEPQYAVSRRFAGDTFTQKGKLQSAQIQVENYQFGTVFEFPSEVKDKEHGLGGIIVAKVRSGSL